MAEDELSHRALAMLRAVAEGRAVMTSSCEPDLFIDGVPCCDQMTAHTLAHRGYLAVGADGRTAELTPAGRAALSVTVAA
ncbi:hypothetical protein SAMN05421835_101359 [Amycolatopsis sacchari]|uniref:ArsR family transcriptional regulator n=2 Tax=Amycolatopsis sacchari TaxID=115433 RepID=A0A1I3K0H3_9PSEU|nr:hypothetical protein SAMN05421835_101359 [Amycolatopsis sacchari]